MIVRPRAMRLAIALALTATWAAPLIAASPALAQTAAPSPAPAPDPGPPPPPPAAAPSELKPEELNLAGKTILYLKGDGTWDTAFETLVDAYKSLYAYMDKQGIKRTGPSMTIYTQADDTGFSFQAAVPIAEAPKAPPTGDMAVGTSPSGKALKFVHRGSYDSMDSTYEAITNYLDDKQIEAQELFVEEYETDPVTTAEEKLVVNVLVPIK